MIPQSCGFTGNWNTFSGSFVPAHRNHWHMREEKQTICSALAMCVGVCMCVCISAFVQKMREKMKMKGL